MSAFIASRKGWRRTTIGIDAREIKRDTDIFRNAQKSKRFVRRRNILEFRDIVRDTAAASAYDVVTKFIGMSKIFLVHRRDVGTRLRPLLLFDLEIRKLCVELRDSGKY
jgi:hypothetical protein